MKEKLLKNILFTVIVIALAAVFILLLKVFNIWGFLLEVENKTFDFRQQIISQYKKANKDIVILAVDDSSYEYIVSTYGAWPAPRDFWAHISDGIEKANPKAIAFDLLFVQNFKVFGNSDKILTDTINKNKNIYVSMTFDSRPKEVRKPIDLPQTLETNIVGNSEFLKKAPLINKINVMGILPDLMKGTDNIGFINVARDKDGILRTSIPIFVYKDKFYKHLDFLLALDILGLDSKNLTIDKSRIINLADGRKIPLTKDGRTYLNWYGDEESFEYIPLWKVDKAIKENNLDYLSSKFKDKIIFVGVTTTSLNDIKSTPTSRMFAGVETHATFLNNIFDNNLIKKTSNLFDIIITIILTLLTGLIVVKSKNVPYAILGVILLIISYSVLTIILMHYFNLWMALVLPLVCSIGAVTGSYAIKYIVTSRDYEHTYKLAVTDGLTDMYNHRYFQEQMKLNIDNTKRYNTPFSLIMVDIDFFKKFNDKYGHQSGDAVLRQVAQTIKKNIRSTDIPCRYGGEEMSVILSNTKKEEAAIVAQKICEAVRNKEFELATGDWTHVTISLGVASAPIDSDSVQGLIEYADKCLYVAKENGRNQVISTIENT